MTAGIRVRNVHGTVQIDDENYNLALRYKGVGAVGPLEDFWRTWTGTFSGLKAPIIAIHCAAPMTLLRAVDLGGGTWSFVLGAAVETASFEYYIFDEITEVPAHGAGLLIFQRSDRSRVAYYSQYLPMRITDVVYDISPYQNFSTSAQKPAIVFGSLGTEVHNVLFQAPSGDLQYTSVFWATCLQLSGNIVVPTSQQVGVVTGGWNQPAFTDDRTILGSAVIIEAINL